MSSKTLIRTGVTTMIRIMNPVLHQDPIRKIVPQTTKSFAPAPFPSLLKLQNPINMIQHDEETFKKSCSEGFLYPCGLPSLRFFLPDVFSNDFMPEFGQKTRLNGRKCVYSGEVHKMIHHQVSPYHAIKELTSLATSGAKGFMATWLVNRPREVDELLLGGLPRDGSESQLRKLMI
ncbi:hypothetical protein R6Q59_021387 [Mikania micrantha]